VAECCEGVYDVLVTLKRKVHVQISVYVGLAERSWRTRSGWCRGILAISKETKANLKDLWIETQVAPQRAARTSLM
jgi:hypothetical protein